MGEQAKERPQIDAELCDGCGDCLLVCPQHGIAMVNDKAQLMDDDECVACGDCEIVCPMGAIGVAYEVVFAEAVEVDGEVVTEDVD